MMTLPFNRILTGNIVFPSVQQNLIFDIQVQKQSSAEYTAYKKGAIRFKYESDSSLSFQTIIFILLPIIEKCCQIAAIQLDRTLKSTVLRHFSKRLHYSHSPDFVQY